MTKLMCPVCGGEMRTDHAMGGNFDVEYDDRGAYYTTWFSEIWECPKGHCFAEDWYFDDEHRDFYEGAIRNKETYWYDPDTGRELKRDDEHQVRLL